jgi:hypothetical protein
MGDVEAARDNRRQLGQLMVDEGFLDDEQLAYALAEQSRTGRPLGTILVELGFVSPGAVGNALAEQHGGLLKTEFGISAGLHAVGEPAPLPAAPDPSVLRIQELESQLQAVLAERNAFAGNLNELNARLAGAAQAQQAEVARVTAAAAAHIETLEAELRNAGVSREELETAVRLGASRIAELQQETAALRQQVEDLSRESAPPEAPPDPSHLLVPSSAGYTLAEWAGPAPESGTLLDVDGLSFVVGRVGASPFPGNRLRCVFLERA